MTDISLLFFRILHGDYAMPSGTKTWKETAERVQGVGYPTPCTRILHPILHPKSLENTAGFTCGCRKCRIFQQNFFERFYGRMSQTASMQIVHDIQ